MKKREYYDFEIDYLEKYEYENLSDLDKESLLELRNLNRRRNQHERWVDKHQKIIDEYNRRLDLIKDIRINEKDVFDDVSLLKKVVKPQITIYKKNESSKSLKDKITHYKRKTYKGQPLKERYVWYCTVRMKTTMSRNQKNIYLGSKEKVEGVLNDYLGVYTLRSERVFKYKMMGMLEDFFTPLLQDGWEKFSYNKSYSFDKVIKGWVKKNKK